MSSPEVIGMRDEIGVMVAVDGLVALRIPTPIDEKWPTLKTAVIEGVQNWSNGHAVPQSEWQEQQRQLEAMRELLTEWTVWYAAQRHIGPTTAHAIIRGDAEWPNEPPSEQSLPALTIALLKQS